MEDAIRKHYRHSAPIGAQGSVMSYRDRYLSLDPTYKDGHGLPLLRLTFDWHDNEYKMAAFSAARDGGDSSGHEARATGDFANASGQSLTTFASIRSLIPPAVRLCELILRTVLSTAIHKAVTFPIFSCICASAFPQNIGYNPTCLLAALAYFSAAKIRDTYLKSPGPFVLA